MNTILFALLFFTIVGITKLINILTGGSSNKKAYIRNHKGEFISKATTTPKKGIRKSFIVTELGQIIRREYTTK